MTEQEPFAWYQPPVVTARIRAYDKIGYAEKVGMIEMSGRFVYLEEKMYGNGGGGLEMYSVSPDNYLLFNSETERWEP